MKLQPASRKEILRAIKGTLVCDGILFAGLFLLSQFGIGTFPVLRILLSILCGSLIAIGNFTLLCLTIQSAVEIESKRKMKARFQLSYNLRMIIQAVWVVACLMIPGIHFIAGAAPVLFPNLWLYYLQFTGKLLPQEESAPAEPQQEPEL